MDQNDFGGEFWDEKQWEQHLNEIEEKSEVIKQLISVYSDSLPRWMHFVKEYASEDEAIDAYIDDELMIEEAYFPEDEDDLDEEFDEVDDFFLSEGGMPFAEDDEEEDELDESEAWKKDARLEVKGDEEEEAFLVGYEDEHENLEIFDESRDLAAYLIKRSKTFPETLRNKKYEDLITRTLDVSCKLASGYTFGFEIDVLGATITYCKKSLSIANECLVLLQELKEDGLFHPSEYQELHGRYFSLRNKTGLYLQDLRDLFKSGGTENGF